MEYEFDVAISFAAQEREIARELARLLKANDVAVFFDEFYAAEMWGSDLGDSLVEIYEKRARYCLILVSQSYCERPYTILERRTALHRALQSPEPYLLLVVTDDAWPQGIPRTTAYQDIRKTSVPEIAALVTRKLRGDERPVALPEDPFPKIVSLKKAESSVPLSESRAGVSFELVRLSPDSEPWVEPRNKSAGVTGFDSVETHRLAHVSDEWWHVFSGGMFGDPILDVTISNRSEEPLLLSAVGIQFSSIAHFWPGLFGSSRHLVPPEVPLAMTFCLELPDLKTPLSEACEAGKVSTPNDGPGGVTGTLEVDELAFAQLPNPVYLEPGVLYRYELALAEYQALVPSEAVVRLWARAGSGEWTSKPILIEYNVGITHGGRPRDGSLRRRLVEVIAERLWSEAGRPAGRDEEFWLDAEREIIMRQAHKKTENRKQQPPDPFQSPERDLDHAKYEHEYAMRVARTRPL